MKSRQPRKQRKSYHNAPLHKKRKRLASHLAEDLIVKYGKRRLPVVRGDTVKVIRGDFKGHTDKVRDVYLDNQTVEIEGAVTSKVDGSKVPQPIHSSNVIITKLNLTDPWRRRKLERGLSEERKEEIEKEAEQQILEQQRMEEEALEAEKAEAEPEAAEEPTEEATAEAEESGETEAVEESEDSAEAQDMEGEASEQPEAEEPEGEEPVEPEAPDAEDEESESVEEEEKK